MSDALLLPIAVGYPPPARPPSPPVSQDGSVTLELTDPFQTSCAAKVGKFINFCTVFLQEPLWICVSWVIQGMMTPLSPGKYGQSEWTILEIFKRVILTSVGIILGPGFLAIAVLASMLHGVGDWLLGDPYVYLSGSHDVHLNKNQEVRILTLNTCMTTEALPIPLGGQAPTSDRLSSLKSKISEKNPHIVCLQETGSKAFYELYDRLKREYAHFFGDIGPKLFSLPSCLCVFSKLPIIGKPEFRAFIGKGLFGYNRGMFYFEIESAWIVNLHLHWNDREEDQAIRKDEMTQVLTLAKELQKRSPNKSVLFVGDFNIKRKISDSNSPRTVGSPSSQDDEYSRSELSQPTLFRNVYKPEKGTYSDSFVNARLGKTKEWISRLRASAKEFALYLPHIHREDEGECILDYTLISQPEPDDKYTYEAERFDTSVCVGDENSISDHHGILLRQIPGNHPAHEHQ